MVAMWLYCFCCIVLCSSGMRPYGSCEITQENWYQGYLVYKSMQMSHPLDETIIMYHSVFIWYPGCLFTFGSSREGAY